MLKKTITYTDFDGVERTEDFYFNLTKAELLDLQMSADGGFLDLIKKIIASKDSPELIRLFKKIVLLSYGEKSDDGKKFRKSEEIRSDFSTSEPFSIIYMELATDPDKASEFVNGILPKDLAEQAKEAINSGKLDEETKQLLESMKN